MKKYRDTSREKRLLLINFCLGVEILLVIGVIQYREYREEQTQLLSLAETNVNEIHTNHKQRILSIISLIESISGISSIIILNEVENYSFKNLDKSELFLNFQSYLNAMGGEVYSVVDTNNKLEHISNVYPEFDNFILGLLSEDLVKDFSWHIHKSKNRREFKLAAIKYVQELQIYVITAFKIPTDFRMTYERGVKVYLVDDLGVGLDINNVNYDLIHLHDESASLHNWVEADAVERYGSNFDKQLKLIKDEHYGIEYFLLEGEVGKYWLRKFEIVDDLNLVVLVDVGEAIRKIQEEPNEFYQRSLILILLFVLFHVAIRLYFSLKKSAFKDELTGLYNRAHFSEFIKTLNGLRKRGKVSEISLISLDLDKFKSVNDNYGHDVGDDVLRRLSEIILSNSRSNDFAYRLGGEEFTIICTEPVDQSAKFAERLRKLIQNDKKLKGFVKGGITASFGVCAWLVVEDIKSALKNADELLYKAKNNGRNQVQVQT